MSWASTSPVARGGAAVFACSCLLLLSHCVPPDAACDPAAAGPPSIGAWRAARERLAELRQRYGIPGAYTMKLSLHLSEPRTGQQLRARGAVAASPGDDSLRMILLGPGGVTALDLWSCRDRYRLALPSVDLIRRGDAHSPAEQRRGLPVDFLRWWLLRPLAGRLLHHGAQAGQERFVLRDGEAIVDVRLGPGGALVAERRSSGDRERVSTAGPGCQTVHYWQQSTGIDITVDCETLDGRRSPKQSAFDDPDSPHDGCRESQDHPRE